jgi:PTS system galactitol-specific IIA component
VAREATYPTGLPTSPEPIALPHADPDGVLVPTVAVGRCRSPVEFVEMATTDRRLPVRLILLLALQSKDQATVLSRLVRAFGEPELMAFLLSSDRPAEIAARLTDRITGDADA